MLALMLKWLWDGERFRVLRAGDHVSNPASRSLIAYLPMILGDRLPADVRARLVRGFRESDLLTDSGPATEGPSSPLFARDGYWRGPIWGPTTMLIADGLEACGERALAVEVARRFAETCRRSGFAENFDALDGRPLRDPTHTWTASAFLVLASRYLAPDEEGSA
jgi:glycogen debranching enzyme